MTIKYLWDNVNHARFAAYWYYRSKGYSVKGGILYSSDYMLYRIGPNFYHSDFGVTVIDESIEKLNVGLDTVSNKFVENGESDFATSSSTTWVDLQASVRSLAKVKKVFSFHRKEFNYLGSCLLSCKI